MKTKSSKQCDAWPVLPPDAAAGQRFGIAVGGYHREIGSKLLAGARATLVRYGASEPAMDVVWVPGCFELPVVLKRMAMSRRYDGLIALGLVIRGETPHFEYVGGEAARGIAQVAYDFGMPVGFGVLTTENVKQAQERAGGRVGNKGEEAATAVLQMIETLKGI